MDILGKARQLESTIARTLDSTAQRIMKSGAREPLEMMHAIVGVVEKEIQPAGRGRQVFPFNRIKVSLAVASQETRARFEAVFGGEPSLRGRILERCQSAGCPASELIVKTVYVSQSEAHWMSPDFHLEFARVTPAVEVIPPSVSAPGIGLTVVHGSAEYPAYSLRLARIDLGRCAEVRDSHNHLIRTNHVALTDSASELNQSVSRRHAHIDYAASVDQYRLYDDRSAHGTGVLRNGRTIAVPPGSRGVRLQSGDEIVLGEVRLRVELVR